LLLGRKEMGTHIQGSPLQETLLINFGYVHDVGKDLLNPSKCYSVMNMFILNREQWVGVWETMLYKGCVNTCR